jgi:serine/threonine-protein kinase HipA
MHEPYPIRDQLALWWMGDPAAPRLVGEIALTSNGRGVSLRYGQEWLRSGFALSDDLPLQVEPLLSLQPGTAPGALDDARPDRWGERVIRKFTKTPRLSLLEFLLFAGGERYGALTVSTDFATCVPWEAGPMPTLDSLPAMHEAIRRVLANQEVPELQRRLVYPGGTLGGARPKSLVLMDGEPWIVKFAETDDFDMPLAEHAAMTLAALAGIDVAPTRALRVGNGHAVAVKRFDRLPGQRLHALSAHVVLRAAGLPMSYPELAQILRRICPYQTIARQQEQLYRRMVFNILTDNTDDHEKNHALLRDPTSGEYTLSPAFDVLPTLQGLCYQGMEVGVTGSESTLENALSRSRDFGLSAQQARAVLREVATVAHGWKAHFHHCGVSAVDMAQLTAYLDSERLSRMRQEALG